jgi:hypothetical protein
LYRNYFGTVYNSPQIPQNLTATPENPLIDDVKSGFLYVDPVLIAGERDRAVSQKTLSHLEKGYTVGLNQFFTEISSKLPLYNLLIDYTNITRVLNLDEVGRGSELYKNPNRPLRKGVSSMLRLHATGAIALPVEIRLQILASSRDVIHS